MSRYDWILLDADGTFLDYPAAEANALVTTLEGIGLPSDPETVARYQRINAGHWEALRRGDTTPQRVRVERWADLLDDLDAAHDAAALAEAYVWNLGQSGHLLEGAKEATLALGRQHRLCLVTNGLGDVQRARLAACGLLDAFDALVISDEIGAAKPDPAYFAEAFTRMGRPSPGACLMVGDHLDADIRGGADAGCDTAWINPGRLEAPDDLAVTHDIASLAQLPALLG